MIRILHVTSNLSRGSGIMSVLMNYYRHMDRTQLQFDFLYQDERARDFREEIAALGGNCYRTARPTDLVRFCKDSSAFAAAHAGEYDAIHIHDFFMSGFFLPMKKQARIPKMIVHSHVTQFADTPSHALRNRILALPNAVLPDVYCACSKKAGTAIFGKKFLRGGIVLNNAIHLEHFSYDQQVAQEVRAELGLKDKFIIGHVGSFTPQKNHDFLVEIFRAVRQIRSDAVLVLVGDGPLKPSILEKCEQLGIRDAVHHLGVRTDVNRIMQCFDRFLFPSNFEGLGIALVEAQSVGVPCIYSDVVPEEANILRESNQMLSLQDDPALWAETVCRSISVDRTAVHDRIREAGYDIEREAGRLPALYREMLEM